MLHLLQMALSLIDSLGDLGTAIVLLVTGIKSVRLIALRFGRRRRTSPPDAR
jgi:hypothetical protein